MSMFNNLNKAPKEIQECLNQYIQAITSETFDTEEEVFEYMKKHSEDYIHGKKGGDLLRYAQKLWIDHCDAFFEWIFKHLNHIFKDDKEAKDELKNLYQFLTFVYYERLQYHDKKPSVKKDFAYDILKWMEEAPKKKLGEFKNDVKYNFNETRFSKPSKKDIWNSFGFNLDKNDIYFPSHQLRLYLSKTRRRISREDGLEVKLKLPLMAAFAEKMNL